MNRYYMTAETRQALIAESNRLLALRAAQQASRAQACHPQHHLKDESTSSSAANSGSQPDRLQT